MNLTDSALRFFLIAIVAALFTTTSSHAQSATQLSGPDTVTLSLDDDWLDDLQVIEDFSRPLDQRFQVGRSGDLCKVQDQRLVIVPAKAKERFGSINTSHVKLSAGEAVAIDTNLRTSLPEGMSAGLVVGPIRLRMASRKESLQVSVHDQPLGSFEPPPDARVTLVVLRDEKDPTMFDWIVKAGDKNIAGRARYTATVPEKAPVGILFRSSKQELESPVWIDDLRIGRISRPAGLNRAAVSEVNAKSDEAE